MDEPFAGVDAATEVAIVELFAKSEIKEDSHCSTS